MGAPGNSMFCHLEQQAALSCGLSNPAVSAGGAVSIHSLLYGLRHNVTYNALSAILLTRHRSIKATLSIAACEIVHVFLT